MSNNECSNDDVEYDDVEYDDVEDDNADDENCDDDDDIADRLKFPFLPFIYEWPMKYRGYKNED